MSSTIPDQHNEEQFVAEDDVIIGRAFRWSLVVFGLLVIAAIGIIWAVSGDEPQQTVRENIPVEPPEPLVQEGQTPPEVKFTDITKQAGIDFTHVSGASGEKLLPETMGGGCGFFDYNNDGHQDIIFISGNGWDLESGQPSHTNKTGSSLTLYENNSDGSFRNVTEQAGLDITCYGMGVACGDYDNDGWVDLFITTVGPNILLHNVNGRFENVTADANVAGEETEWSTSAGFFDYDIDSDLDLFVCNYVRWSPEIDRELDFTLTGIGRAYGPPISFAGTYSSLYRNEGKGYFTDVSSSAGIWVDNPAQATPAGKSLAVTFADIDEDGYQDILVANDTVRNFLFHNLGDGTFEEIGSASGVAYDSAGSSTGAMGIDAADLRNEEKLAVAIGNFANEPTSLYVQQRELQFADMAATEGLASPSRLRLTFGLFFFDYDLDGRLDLLQTNGHLEEEISQVQSSQHYLQSAQLFWNCGAEAPACLVAVDERKQGDLSTPIVGRGSSYADIDHDGDLDVLLTQIDGRPLLLRNDQLLDHHWLRVKLVGDGDTINRDGIGCQIELTTGDETQQRTVMPTRSYLSQVELPITFGLGKHTAVDSLKISWTDGSTQIVSVAGVDQTITVEKSSDDQTP